MERGRLCRVDSEGVEDPFNPSLREQVMDSKTRIPLHTGRRMPVLGLGTWKLTHETAATVEAAIEAGYRMIDTAVDYGSQQGIGVAIRNSGITRDELYVVSKIEEDDDPRQGVERDLAEMQLDYADLTLIHRPPPGGPGESLWRGLIAAQEDGLVRDIGVSNYSAALVDDLVRETGVTPVVNQVEWSPLGHDESLFEHHGEKGIVIQAYSPLTRAEKLDDRNLGEVARSYGKTPAQIMLRWNLQRGTVPLPKANRREHFLENLDIFDFEISAEDMKALDALDRNYSALGGLAYV